MNSELADKILYPALCLLAVAAIVAVANENPANPAALELGDGNVHQQLSTTELVSDAEQVKQESRLALPATAGAELQAPEIGETEDGEVVWAEITDAISGLNGMVGGQLFRDLRRVDSNQMEVRLDADYWQRVLYQTRVDLKNDISNIWHLYVQKYNNSASSSVFFIDDVSGKTIDIFSKVGSD